MLHVDQTNAHVWEVFLLQGYTCVIMTSDETMIELNRIIVADSCKSPTINVWALKSMSLTSAIRAIDSFPFISYFVYLDFNMF